jgi:ERCC4-related helicase
MISHVELRKEESPDIAVFTHKRNMETVVVSLGTYLSSVRERFMLVCWYCLVLYVYYNRSIFVCSIDTCSL